MEGFNAFYQNILLINPGIQVVLTVSPVRHIKDGISQNQLSKSLLNVLCHQLVATYPEVYYFPAYEIMMDDLRDYRFYKDDMIHPSLMAEEYIWEQFQTAFLMRIPKTLFNMLIKYNVTLTIDHSILKHRLITNFF